MAKLCSAVEMVFPSGALMTTTPALVAAFKSMLSTPTPARPMAFNFLPASIIAGVTFGYEREGRHIRQ